MKTAAKVWGYGDDETEAAFDPLVNLLFSACSLELEKISHEVHASRARMMERMVQLLSPEVLTGPLPAHAVVVAKAAEPQSVAVPTDQFYTTTAVSTDFDSAAKGYKDVFFAPAGSYFLNPASVQYLATGQQLFRYRDAISKEVVAQSSSSLPPSVLWIGLSGYDGNLAGTQIYFDIRNEVNRTLFYDNLREATWFEGDNKIEVRSGYSEEYISGEELDPEQLLTQKHSQWHSVRKRVNAFYKKKFITIRKQPSFAVQNSEAVPLELRQAFDKANITPLEQQNIRWIKIRFPQTVTNTLLQDVVCYANSFPVINCRMHETTFRLHEMLNIAPLYSPDAFFALHEVNDAEGNPYHNRALHNGDKQKLSILLRQGGVGRFDERNAAAIVENILQLLNDESAAFSVLGKEFLAGEMKQLQQVIYKLEQQLLSRSLHREETPFLIVRQLTKEPIGNLFVRFWSTVGSEANDIKAGTALQVYQSDDGYQTGCNFLTPTVGGRDKLSASDSITAYKSALLSRDRLISKEDIKTFCRLQLGSKAKEIEVKKGVMLSQKTSQGFARTLDITIRMERKDFMDIQEKNGIHFLKEDLALQLSQKSAVLVPFRIFVEQVA